MKKGQSWSMDVVIAVVIFGFIAVIFYSLIVIEQQPSRDDLLRVAQDINTKLELGVLGCGAIIDNQTLTQAQIQCLYNQSYQQVKDQFGISPNAHFCIYIQDSNGRLYIVDNGSTNKTGFGDPTINISGQPCSQ